MFLQHQGGWLINSQENNYVSYLDFVISDCYFLEGSLKLTIFDIEINV